MSNNLTNGKLPTASSCVLPYVASRTTDGAITAPQDRWLTTTLPAALMVDLQSIYYVNRWVVSNLGAAQWQNTYNMKGYSLQCSLDSQNWWTVDSVSNNTASATDRTFPPVLTRFVRLYIASNSGMAIHPTYASIARFEVWGDLPTSGYLTSLAISAGALTPTFSKTTYAYSSTVGFNVASTTVTAVLEDANAQLKINGVAAVSGQPSNNIPLAVGNNTIPIQVTPQLGPVQPYTVTVIRSDSTRLTSLTARDNLNNPISLKPSFDSNTTLYNVCIPQDSTATVLNITPVKEGVNAIIAVNGTAVTSGTPWPVTIPAVGGSVNVPFKVSAPQLADTTYTVNVAKATSAYLQSVTGIPGVNFVKTTYDYTTSVTVPKVKTTVIPEDTSAAIEVTVNGTSIPYTQSLSFTPNIGLNELVIKVTSSFGGDSRTYAFHITKS